MNYYPLIIQQHQGLKVVRGDLYPGGLKCRVLTELLVKHVKEQEIVYAGCYYGHSGYALGVASLLAGKKVSLFMPGANRDTYIHNLVLTLNSIRSVPVESNHQDETFRVAQQYASDTGARLLPIGLNFELFTDLYTDVIRSVCKPPEEVCMFDCRFLIYAS